MRFVPLLVLAFLASAALAQPVPDAPSALPAAAFVQPDGTLDLRNAPAGALDLAGFDVRIGEDGQLHTFAPGDYTDIGAAPEGPGVNNVVAALAVGPDGSLYAGGYFTTAGDAAASRVARWDGNQWHALGGGVNGSVLALAVGSDGSLYAGGSFTTAGGQPSSRVARWDGTTWSALGAGVNHEVHALAIGVDGSLYAGGLFTSAGSVAASGVARWDGTTWNALGSGVDSDVLELVVGPDGSLYAGGRFTTAGGQPASRVARWDGTAWSALGDGLNATVYALAVGPDGRLYAGGFFTAAGSEPVSYLAQWDGTAWSALGAGLDQPVFALRVGPDGSLYAGGRFTTAAGTPAGRLARWDGAAWSALGGGVNADVSDLAFGPDGRLYAGGYFTSVVGTVGSYVAQWNGTAWSGLGSSVNNRVRALAVGPDGSLYAGGSFTMVAGMPANYIARWDGTAWHALGSGVNNVIAALAVAPDGTLYAGGAFTHAGGVEVNYVARWNGTSWHALGRGVSNVVYALAVAPSGALFVGGAFDRYFDGGGNPFVAGNVAMWSGGSWSALGGYFARNGVNDIVFALALGPGGLYAGGRFTQASGVWNAPGVNASRVALWSGGTWSALGAGVDGGDVNALVAGADGSLYAGGNFTTAGGTAANRVARWNGAAWSSLGDGVNSTVLSLAVGPDGGLYAGGGFTAAGGQPAIAVARWDGAAWSPLGSGVNNVVWDLAITTAGDLALGGDFTSPGTRVAFYDLPRVGSYAFVQPTAGATYRTGAWLKAIWTSPAPAPPSVRLDLRRGAGPWQTLYEGANLTQPDFGAARWRIPAGTVSADDYQLRIASADDPDEATLSQRFTIVDRDGVFAVTAPAVVARGGSAPVTWTPPAAVPGGTVTVALVDRASGAVVASETTDNDGAHALAVPANAPLSRYVVRVASVEAPLYVGASARLRVAVAVVTAPSGGEAFAAGDDVVVSYDAPTLVGPVSVRVILRSVGGTAGTLARLSAQPTSGSVVVTLPADLPSGDYVVKVRLAGAAIATATSGVVSVTGTAPRASPAVAHFAMVTPDGLALPEATLSVEAPALADGAEIGVFAPASAHAAAGRAALSLVGAGVVRGGRAEITVHGGVVLGALVTDGRPDADDVVGLAAGAPLSLRLFDGTAETALDAPAIGFADGAELAVRVGTPPAGAGEALTVSAWPNPATSAATVRVSAPAAVAVFDALGRRVATLAPEPGATELRWETAGVAPGVYVIRASTADATAAVRVTVVR